MRLFMLSLVLLVLASLLQPQSVRGEESLACTPVVEPLIRANDLFTQADTQRQPSAKALWDEATAILAAHRDDIMSEPCKNADNFDLLRAKVLLHGLDVGIAVGGKPIFDAENAANAIWRNTIATIDVRHGSFTAEDAVQTRNPESYTAASHYLEHIRNVAAHEYVVAHHPTDAHCLYPNLDVHVLSAVVPTFQSSQRMPARAFLS